MSVRKIQIALGLLAVASAATVLSDLTYWDRYLNAYTFETFVENPYPTLERLYPQEQVEGVARPREFDRADAADQLIPASVLADVARFAEQSDSTSLIIYHDGRIVMERYWQGGDRTSVVYSFSMHKSVVALLIGIAIDEGHIGDVDDSLAKYITEWRDDPRAAITIRQALQMSTGLEPMSFPINPFSKHVKRQIGTDLLRTAVSFQLAKPPGSEFSYNGVNPTLLLIALERATGQRYANYLSEKLWRPLGNQDAAVWLDHENGLARGATSLFAVPMDWMRIGEMLLSGGTVENRQVVPPGWLEEMTTPSLTNSTYGLLTWIGSDYAGERTLESFEGFAAVAEKPFNAGDLFYFDGLGGQRVYVVPSRKLIIVRTGVLAWEWQDTELPNMLVSAIDGAHAKRAATTKLNGG